MPKDQELILKELISPLVDEIMGATADISERHGGVDAREMALALAIASGYGLGVIGDLDEAGKKAHSKYEARLREEAESENKKQN